MGSNLPILVLYHHFGWAIPSSAKSRVDEGRPNAFKTRFFDFRHRSETQKHPWNRFYQFRFHTTILGGLLQAVQKAGLTKVVQLRSKRVFSSLPIGAKRKNTLGIEFHEVGFIPPCLVGFCKQRKKPGWRRSSNSVQNSFFRLSPLRRNEESPLESNLPISVSYHHFCRAFASTAKSRVDEGRPIALKTHFFDFPHRCETKKHPWDRIPRGRFHTTILSGLLQAAQKAGLTKFVQLRWKLVFSSFPIGAKRKNTLGIEFHEACFIPPFWVGFSKQRKKPGWRRSSNCVQNAFFQLFTSWPDKKKQPWNQILQFRFHATILGGLFQAAEKAGLTKVVQLRSKLVFSTFPIGAKRKNTLGSNSTSSLSYHHFGRALPRSGKRRVDEKRPIALKTRFFEFSHMGETKKHPLDRIPRGRFDTTILGWLFPAAQKAGLTKVVQLRSKLVFWTFPIEVKRKNTLGIEFHEVGFIPPFWVGFSKQRETPIWRRSSNCVENSVFRLSPLGRNEETPFGSNYTRSVSYHHFRWAFPSSAKLRVDEGRPIAFKTRFVEIPHRVETKQHPWDRIPRGWFHTTILGGLYQAAENAGLTKVVQLRSKLVFWHSPSGRNEKAPLGSNSTRSVSYHHFGWALPSSGKRRDNEVLPIGLKTRFFDFPHRSETKKHTWDRIPRGRFYTTILGWTYQAAEKAGLTKVIQLGWKLVLSSSPIRGKQKKTLGIEFHEVGFIPPFFLGFCMQCKKPGWRRSSNCVENSFRRISPSGRNEKTPLGSNSTRSVSHHHFRWAFPSNAKSRVDEGRPIAFKTRFFDFSHRGETKKHPWDGIPRARFHTTIFSGLFQAGQKAGLTKVVQLRWKLVSSSFPIGAKRKNTLGFEFHEVGFIPLFLLGFTKQRKTLGWRRSSNCVQNSFCRVSPSGRNEKTPLGSNSTRSVSYHHFCWALPSSGKRRVEEGRPIAFKTRFVEFPHRCETKKHPWDRIPRGRFHTTILGGIYQGAENAGLTKVVQLRWKLVFSSFPIWANRKNTLWIEFHEVGFTPPFSVGFSQQRKKPGWRRSSNCVQNSFFRLFPSGRNEKTPLGSNSMRSVSYPYYCWALPSSGKRRVDEGRPIAFKTRFVEFPHRGETKKHPCDQIPRGRFHTTILGGIFQAAQNAGLTKVVQLGWKLVLSSFPIGTEQKNTLGIKFHEVVFIPPFLLGFCKQCKKAGWRMSSNCVENSFFRVSPSGWNEKTPFGSNSTRSASYHHLGGLFPAAQKAGLTKVVQLRSKLVFSTIPIGAKRKNTLGIEFHEVGFIPPFWGEFTK